MALSKSKYTQGIQCPKILWLRKHKPEEYDESVMNQTVLDNGNLVGDLAMGYYGDYVEVEFNPENFGGMIAKTKELIKAKTPIITEATFSKGGNFAMVDILKVFDDDIVEITEVKSSTHGILDPKKPNTHYLDDIAYQVALLQDCGYTVRRACLLYVNNKYVLDGELDIHEYFIEEDVTELALGKVDEVRENVKEFNAYVKLADEPEVAIGCQCSKPYACPFKQYCWRNIPENSVFDLAGIRVSKALKLRDRGLDTFAALRGHEDEKDVKLNSKQKRQLRMTLDASEKEWVDYEKLTEFVDGVSYPVAMFDFETFKPAVPRFQGTYAYQQIPSQYSLHVIEKKGAPAKHYEFLSREGSDPRSDIAESMAREIPDGATLMSWNKRFEHKCINELAAWRKDLADKLLALNEGMVDLEDAFSKEMFYHRDMNGSFSVKKVLPALFPNDPELDYHALDGVQNGEEAADIFLNLGDGTHSEEEIAAVRESLLRYCELDTLAMVKIWDKLNEVVDEHRSETVAA